MHFSPKRARGSRLGATRRRFFRRALLAISITENHPISTKGRKSLRAPISALLVSPSTVAARPSGVHPTDTEPLPEVCQNRRKTAGFADCFPLQKQIVCWRLNRVSSCSRCNGLFTSADENAFPLAYPKVAMIAGQPCHGTIGNRYSRSFPVTAHTSGPEAFNFDWNVVPPNT